MTTHHLVTIPERLDQCIARLHSTSRSQAAKIIDEGRVLLNDRKILKSSKAVLIGDRVEIREEKKKEEEIPRSSLPFDIPTLYEDSFCLVINKPTGFAVHPSESSGGQHTIIEMLRTHYGKNLDLVHRLDKETTGCLLIAKDTKSHALLQEQFQSRSIKKTYLAIVAGILEEKKARIEAEIGRSLVNRVKMSLFKTGYSRPAVTNYEVVSAGKDASLLRCEIETGRTHQIRVHLSSIGHPILGDNKYSTSESRSIGDSLHVTSLCLHAWKLQFTALGEKREVTVQAPIPVAFKENAERCNLRLP
ncbi:MAG TPA: RluA family pseudouridine synthase [Candidatus Peribacterales bacterium]|nr:RluA family pseudouridine synthase [Candidatus Peribacterales bacterium]